MAVQLNYLTAFGLLALCVSFSSSAYMRRNFHGDSADSGSDEMVGSARENKYIDTNAIRRQTPPTCSASVCCSSSCTACTYNGTNYYCRAAGYLNYYGLYGSANCIGGLFGLAGYIPSSTCPPVAPASAQAPAGCVCSQSGYYDNNRHANRPIDSTYGFNTCSAVAAAGGCTSYIAALRANPYVYTNNRPYFSDNAYPGVADDYARAGPCCSFCCQQPAATVRRDYGRRYGSF